MKMRLFNNTSHVLVIKKDISIQPKGSIVRGDLQYSDHIKRLERNGFLAITIYPDEIVVPSENQVVEASNEVIEEVATKRSRKSVSNDTQKE